MYKLSRHANNASLPL